ncbi:hypothetical protein UlMin_034536 [Ulmus minor]
MQNTSFSTQNSEDFQIFMVFLAWAIAASFAKNEGYSATIGVNYGFNGDNLPPPATVIDLYQRCNISVARIFEPRAEVLEAWRGKPTTLILGTRNEDVQSFAKDQQAATNWIATFVLPYINDVNIAYITVGNEIIPSPVAQFIAQAIKNLLTAISNAQITKHIQVTTVMSAAPLASSFPPSAGAFSEETVLILKDIAAILSQQGTPMMINVYPYFAYASNPKDISLDYALFRSPKDVVIDGNFKYSNLFDAMIDAFHAGFEKIGFPNTILYVTETGWPSAGNEPYTTIDNAATYNKNLLAHVGSNGTPRRSNEPINTIYFALFNEDLKPAGVEQNFGFFYPSLQRVYPFWSC